jgi:hypothetical protein
VTHWLETGVEPGLALQDIAEAREASRLLDPARGMRHGTQPNVVYIKDHSFGIEFGKCHVKGLRMNGDEIVELVSFPGIKLLASKLRII